MPFFYAGPQCGLGERCDWLLTEKGHSHHVAESFSFKPEAISLILLSSTHLELSAVFIGRNHNVSIPTGAVNSFLNPSRLAHSLDSIHGESVPGYTRAAG